MEVEVVMPIVDGMGLEVVCPPVVTPGEFFVCTADIPQGSDLIFSLVMLLLLGYLYLRFYHKKSISVFCEETRGWMDTNWQKIRALRGFIET